MTLGVQSSIPVQSSFSNSDASKNNPGTDLPDLTPIIETHRGCEVFWKASFQR